MVAPATRAEVLAAVEAVGFVPNRAARHLVSGRAGAIGVVVPDIANPYFAAILKAIQVDARADDLGVLIADTGGDPAEERRALASLDGQVDGLVVLTPVTDLATSRLPMVQVNRQSRLAPSVVVDQTAVVALALDHLAAQGHRRLAVVGGPIGYWSSGRRTHALRRLLADPRRADLRVDEVGPAPATFAAGRALLDLVRRTGATGVVAFNDVQAAGLLVAAHDAGLSVPGDLSVVGSDGLDLASMTAPVLTTVAAPLDQIGRAAVARLGDLLAGRRAAHRTVLEPRLVDGASTAPPSMILPSATLPSAT